MVNSNIVALIYFAFAVGEEMGVKELIKGEVGYVIVI
jgi:hypothetical protein